MNAQSLSDYLIMLAAQIAGLCPKATERVLQSSASEQTSDACFESDDLSLESVVGIWDLRKHQDARHWASVCPNALILNWSVIANLDLIITSALPSLGESQQELPKLSLRPMVNSVKKKQVLGLPCEVVASSASHILRHKQKTEGMGHQLGFTFAVPYRLDRVDAKQDRALLIFFSVAHFTLLADGGPLIRVMWVVLPLAGSAKASRSSRADKREPEPSRYNLARDGLAWL
ncbi:hypothetical protein C8F01DRAFT_1088743 [Mycena amicta]|nr:hypothetical protein C8F01DRAFT_1088743 [Mycena amicta]